MPDASTPADRVAAARTRLAELLDKHPEMRPYTLPATAGDIADLGKKLDEIADLLRRQIASGGAGEATTLTALLGRFLASPPIGESPPQAQHAPTGRQVVAGPETDRPSAPGGRACA